MAHGQDFADDEEWNRALRAAYTSCARSDRLQEVASDRMIFGGDQDSRMLVESSGAMLLEDDDTEMFNVILGRMVDEGAVPPVLVR